MSYPLLMSLDFPSASPCNTSCPDNIKTKVGKYQLYYLMCNITEDVFIIFAYILYFFRCYECGEKLSTHCNKKVLAQIVDFLQKHVTKTQTSKLSSL